MAEGVLSEPFLPPSDPGRKVGFAPSTIRWKTHWQVAPRLPFTIGTVTKLACTSPWREHWDPQELGTGLDQTEQEVLAADRLSDQGNKGMIRTRGSPVFGCGSFNSLPFETHTILARRAGTSRVGGGRTRLIWLGRKIAMIHQGHERGIAPHQVDPLK